VERGSVWNKLDRSSFPGGLGGLQTPTLRGPRSGQSAALLTVFLPQPMEFVSKANYRLKKRPEGYRPGSDCANFVGLAYLESIRRNRHIFCGPDSTAENQTKCAQPSECSSMLECYTPPSVPAGNKTEATVALCRSRNLVLDSCKFFSGQRKGRVLHSCA
jgi:hypothetical protein